MCGIAGVVGVAPADRAHQMRAMRETVVHRGPDSVRERCGAHRRKQGFGLPVGRWLRRELRPMLDEIVLSARALGAASSAPKLSAVLRASISPALTTHWLWCLLMLEVWHREFVYVRESI